jgi:hypothetical protein
MRGVLKPPAHGREAYSQVIPLQVNAYYVNGQYPQQAQQSPAQQSQSNTWPAAPETPYYPSTGAYGTPSTQYSNQNNGVYPSVEQSPSAPQATQYHGYDARSNSYTYPDPAQTTTPYVQQRPGASVDPESPIPDSTPKHDRMLYGQRYQNTVHDLEELMERLQVEIDASFVDGVHECCKTELTLGGNAFVPLMRPNIGPYADGGKQDLPAEFKKNFPPEVAKDKEPSQEENQAEPQTQSQDTPQQQDADAAPATQQGNNAPESQQPASSSAPKQTPTKLAVPEPEDPLKLCPRATVDTILNIDDPDLRAIIQRAASRGLVQRIVNLDGYKYMFNNYWQSRVDGDGMRYSYICRDSLQNKDRFSHVPARATTTAPSHRHPTPRRTKESWDCLGSLSIKFSSNANAIIVQYRHAALHPTHLSRKKPPRKPAVPKADRPPKKPKAPAGTKRKRGPELAGAEAGVPEPMSFARPAAREPSMFDLLQQSAIESAANENGGQLGDASRPWWENT